MSDLAIGVRLHADGSGVVGQVGAAAGAIDRLKGSLEGASSSARNFSAAGRGGGGLDEAGRAAGEYERILTRLENRYDQAGAALRRYSEDVAATPQILWLHGASLAPWCR